MLSRLRAAHAKRLRDRGDAGMTLAELAVSMGLATVVGAMTLVVFLSANTTVRNTDDQLIGTANARNILQSWRGLIQVADAPQPTGNCPTGSTAHRFEWLTTTETLFYAGVNNRSSDDACTPPQLIWLAVRDGRLLEARYTITPPATTYVQTVCRTLSSSTQAKVSAGTLFAPNPGEILYSVDYGQSFAATGPFSSAVSCATAPTSLTPASVTNTDTNANNALAQVTSVGIDFTVTNSAGTHSQTYDATVAIYGGSGA